jgi:hypothetical protein
MAISVSSTKVTTGTTWIVKVGCALGRGVNYMVSGQWVVDFVQQLISFGGRVSESAFLIATVYVTLNTVAHLLLTWIFPGNVILVLNQVSVIAFAVLPELIIFNALQTTYDHWKMVINTKRVGAWAWAIAYSIPTAIFLVMTVVTICSFVSLETINAATYQTSGFMLVIRCLAGWGYSMVQRIWKKKGYESYAELFDSLRGQTALLAETVKDRDGSIGVLQQEKTTLSGQVQTLGATLVARDDEVASLKRDANKVAALVAELEELKEQCVALDAELIDTRIALASANRKAKSDNVPADDETLGSPVVTTEKYQLIREHMQAAILRGDRVNMRKIASSAGVHYNTVRRYAQSIIDELAHVHNQAKQSA